MNKPWSAVSTSSSFQQLPAAEQDAARRQYFDQVVAPRVPEGERESVWAQFDSDTRVAKRDLPASVAPSTAGAGRGRIAPAMPTAQPSNAVSVPPDVAQSEGIDFGATATDMQGTAPPARAAAATPAPSQPKPYRNRVEALDDAVNLIEEGADPQQVAKVFSQGGIDAAEIQAHGVGRKSPAFDGAQQSRRQIDQYTAPATPTEPGPASGSMQAWEPSAAGEAANAVRRGATQAGQMTDAMAFQAGVLSPEGMAQQAQRRQRDLGAAAPSGDVAAGIERLQQANETGSYAEVGKAVLTPANWKAVAALVTESMIATTPALAATVAASIAGGPLAGAAAAGMSSFAMEYGAALGETLENRGVDLSRPDQVRAALESPEILAEARQRGQTRGIPVAAFDALSAGFAGRYLGAVSRAVEGGQVAGRKAVGATVAATSKEAGMQAGLGMAGEAVGQAGVGENRPLDVILEGLAEVPGGFAEARGNLAHVKAELAKREAQAKRLAEAGEKEVAATLQRRVDAERAELELQAVADKPWGADPEYQQRYRTLRAAGTKPAEASARAAMAAAYRRIGEEAGVSPKAFSKAVEAAAALPLDKVAPFFDKFTAGLVRGGMLGPIPADTVSGTVGAAGDEAMTAALAQYEEDSPAATMAAIEEMEQAAAPAAPAAPAVEAVALPAEEVAAPAEAAGPWAAYSAEAEVPASAVDSVVGEPLDSRWTAFTPESGTKGIPRAQMPQIKAEHRGAMVNFLTARGITHEAVEVPAGELKPTQAEFSPKKLQQAKAFTGGDRSILISSDGHVLDGHHQWLAKLDTGEPVKAIRLNAPIEQLVNQVREFPSAEVASPVPQAQTAQAAPAAPDAAAAPGSQGAGPDARADRAGVAGGEGTAAVAKGLRVGPTPNSAEPVTVKGGVVHIGGYEAVDFNSGEPITVPAGASDEQVKQALRDSGALSKRQKFFGGSVEASVDTQKAEPETINLGKSGPKPAGGKTARQRAYEANPFKAFLGKHGVALAEAGEFAPGPTERRAAMVPGFGPIFRKTGMRTDLLAQAAVEEGFLLEADQRQLYDLIDRALAGERIVPQYAEGVIEQEMERRLQAHIEQHDELDGLTPDDLDAEGYDRGDEELQARVRELMAHAEQGGIDIEAILEDAARKAQNGTQDDYLADARQALEAALAEARSAGAQDRGGPAGAQGDQPQEAGPSAEGLNRVAEPAPEYSQPYETDLFGTPLPRQQSLPDAGRAGPALTRPAEPAVRGNAQPAAAVPGDAAQDARGEFYADTYVSTPTQRTLGAARINSPADLAQATQYLYKSAVERFDAIVTDKHGKPLAVVGGFKGTVTQTAVYPAVVVGEAIRVPGAANIWFSHNHPSGKSTLSRADEALNAALRAAFQGSGIRPHGLMAVSRDKYSFDGDSGTESERPIPAAGTSVSVPVYERELRDERQAPVALSSPAHARVVAKEFHARAKEPGILLLDAQNQVSGWIPLPGVLRGPLRDTGGLAALYKALSRSTASGAIFVHEGELDAPARPGAQPGTGRSIIENIGGALLGVDVRPLDAVNVKTGVSLAEMGGDLGRPGAFFARGADEKMPSGLTMREAAEKIREMRAAPVGEIQALVDDMTKGWKDKPAIEVVRTAADLPVKAPPDARGLYSEGKVWIVAAAHRKGPKLRQKVASTLAHEAVAHHGLRNLLGPVEFKKFMANIQLALASGNKPLAKIREDVRAAYRNDKGEYTLSRDDEADEIAARAVELAIDEDGNFRPGFSFLKAAWARIAQFLRDLGIDVQFTPSELHGMLARSLRGLEVGKRTVGGGDVVVAAAREGAKKADEFVAAPGGSIDYGEITPAMSKAMRRQAGKIRLQLGDDTFGLQHIEQRHGKEIRAAGFPDVPSFVLAIASGFNKVYQPASTSQLVLLETGDHLPRRMFVELRPADDGDFYTVRTAYTSRQEAKKEWKVLWEGNRAQSPAASGEQPPFAVPPQNTSGAATNPSGQSKDIVPPAGVDGTDGPLHARGEPELFDSDSWSAPEPTRTDRVIYELQDGRVDLKRVQQAIQAAGRDIEERFDARQAETLYMGRVARRSEVFLRHEVKPLLEAVAKAGATLDELGDYLIARHAPERNAQVAKVNPKLPDGGAGSNSKGELMTNEAARAYLAGIPPQRKAQLAELATRVDRITAGTRGLLVAEGLEKQATIDAWNAAYQHYVPLHKEEGDHPHPQGMGFTVKGPASKRATGSTKGITNVLAHVLMQREAAIARAEKNRVGLSLYGLALSHPNPDFWTTIKPSMSGEQITAELERMGVDPEVATAGMQGIPTIRDVDRLTGKVVDRPNPIYKSLPGAITLKVSGEDRVLLLNVKDPRAERLASSLKNLDGLTAVDIAGSVFGKITRWMAAVNTQFNPAFGLANLIRDTLGGSINLGSTPLRGNTLKVLALTPMAMQGIARGLYTGDKSTGDWAKLWAQFQDDGGRTGWRDAFAQAEDRAKAIEKELAALGRGRLSPGRAAHAVLDLLGGFNMTLENAVRLSAYKVALDKGMSRAAAAKLGRELTVDFNRKGRAGREIGPLYAFFNASLQGAARTIEALKGPTGAKIITGGLALGAIQALLLAVASYDEDDLKEFEKTRALIIPTNWTGVGKKTHIMIPYPLGLHVLPNTGRVITELSLNGGKEWGKRAFHAVGEIASAFNPLGGGNIFTPDGALKTMAPTVVDPLIEIGYNKNFAGNSIEREQYNEKDPRPGAARARESTMRSPTGQVYLGISKAINSALGGTTYQAAEIGGVRVSPTPEMIRYLAQTVGGGLLREIEKAVDASIKTARDEKVLASGLPVVGRFYGEVDDERVAQSRYYRSAERIDRFQASLKAAEKAGDVEVVRRLIKENPELVRVMSTQDDISKQLRELNRLAVTLIDRPEQMAAVDKERAYLMRTLNDSLKKLEEQSGPPTLAQRLKGVTGKSAVAEATP